MYISKNSEWDSLVSSEHQFVTKDFWAPFCPHCSTSKPAFESLLQKEQYTKFVGVNIDQMPDIASKKYETQGVSVVKLFCESKEVGEVAGCSPKDNFRKDINKMGVRSAPSRPTNQSSVKPSANNTIPMLNGGEAE